jgi:Spy/CpxP family protein refolding chaperone
MKKILALALALGATALLACPMQGGMNNGPMGGCMMQKCQCDTSKLPKPFEALGLNDAQKGQVQKIREEGKEFHNKQHDKMMVVLTSEQRAKLEGMQMMMGQNCPNKGDMKGMKMGEGGMGGMNMGGMGCKSCDKK